MSKVLFVGHSAGRTGAPIVLLNALRWISKNSSLALEVLLMEDGDLRSAYESLAPTHVAPRVASRRRWWNIFPARDAASRSALPGEFRDHYAAADIGLIFANTLTLGRVLQDLEFLDCPVITFVHELSHWIEKSGQQNLDQVRIHTDHFLAASKAVQAHLVEQVGIAPEKVSVQHEFIPVDDCIASTAQQELIRTALGVDDTDFVVVGSGHETWRKGKDLFVEIAREVLRSTKQRFHFIWVGGWEGRAQQLQIEALVRKHDLCGTVHFVGQVDNPIDYFACGHVFAMVSREDPYPLVCLEAASLGLPILCFAAAGGMPEFVEDDAGIIVPHQDTAEMAKSVLLLQSDRDLLIRLGRRAAEKVRSQHDVSVGASALVTVMEKMMSTPVRNGATFD